jgi:aminomethyltransferase
MAYVPMAMTAPGTALEIDIRGRRVAAVVVDLPFYKRPRSVPAGA